MEVVLEGKYSLDSGVSNTHEQLLAGEDELAAPHGGRADLRGNNLQRCQDFRLKAKAII